MREFVINDSKIFDPLRLDSFLHADVNSLLATSNEEIIAPFLFYRYVASIQATLNRSHTAIYNARFERISKIYKRLNVIGRDVQWRLSFCAVITILYYTVGSLDKGQI